MGKVTTPGEKHFTASVFILSKESPKKVVLVHHKKHGVWLQPGGHIEPFENPVEAAVREVKEETGIDISFLLRHIEPIDHFGKMLPTPKFFLEETIPAHKAEPEHFHLDLFYTVEVAFQEVILQAEESHEVGWFTVNEALKLPMYENTKLLLKQVLQK